MTTSSLHISLAVSAFSSNRDGMLLLPADLSSSALPVQQLQGPITGLALVFLSSALSSSLLCSPTVSVA